MAAHRFRFRDLYKKLTKKQRLQIKAEKAV